MHPILLFVFSRHTSVYKFSSRCCRRSEMFQAQFDNKSSKWVDLSSLSKSATDRKGSSITLCICIWLVSVVTLPRLHVQSVTCSSRSSSINVSWHRLCL